MIPLKTFKLFGVNGVELEKYLRKSEVPYTLSSSGNDYLLNLDFSTLNESVADGKLKDFISKYKSHVYAESNVTLKQQLIKILTVRKAKISVAESFTEHQA